MTYLIPNISATNFEARVHHFTARPKGPRLVECPSSRMVVVAAPWSEVRTVIPNLGTMRVAAYLLAGATWPEGATARVYIGETRNVVARMQEHLADPTKKFVSEVFIIGSRDTRFEKLDVQLLQYYLNQWTEKLDRAFIVRGVRPSLPKVDLARRKRSEEDLADIRKILPSVGCNVLEPQADPHNNYPVRYYPPYSVDRTSKNSRRDPAIHADAGEINPTSIKVSVATEASNSSSPITARTDEVGNCVSLYYLRHAGYTASGYRDGTEFVVLPRSQMRRTHMPSFIVGGTNWRRRQDIEHSSVLLDSAAYSDRWELTAELRFPSQGIAASVLMGMNLNKDAWVENDAGLASSCFPPQVNARTTDHSVGLQLDG